MSAFRNCYPIDTTSLFNPTPGTIMNPIQGQSVDASSSPAVRSFIAPETPLLEQTSRRINELAHDGMEAVHGTTRQVRDAAWRAADSTSRLVRNEPLKSMLVAAAAGAALMALVGLLVRARTAA